ncbi:magnesium and cobalt transport protein CorA [Kineosporia sp. A_224]|uniref:magnesium and cobalt transport protein CorA n=1 Tax=Kineosporia sp. A_224 TaxID=1962180 RepID=UPI000B4AF72E|nr:magnesium and cobalt transport protein CorA [Kineosporia sp. A_224]
MERPLPRFALRRLPVAREGLAPGLLDTVVGWGRYIDGTRCDDARFDEALAVARSGDGFLWLGAQAPNMRQLTQLGEIFDLHALAVEDAANLMQRPKLERYDGILALSLRTLAYVERDAREDGGDVVETGTVMIFVGEDFALTVRHGRHASMSDLRRQLEADPEQLALGPSAVLHAVADKIVDDYLAVVDAVNEDIEEIENNVFASRTPSDIERIYQLKRDVIEMKRTVTALSGPIRELATRPNRLVHPEIQEYFRDVADHLDRVREHVATFDELLSSILQAGLARLSVSESEDMRKISAWVAIAAVPTMIAGIYGMNFAHMPELGQTWGYPAVLTGMAAICGGLYRGFRRNGWL